MSLRRYLPADDMGLMSGRLVSERNPDVIRMHAIVVVLSHRGYPLFSRMWGFN